MKTYPLLRPLPLLALLLGLSTTTARADNADLDVPGPSGRSTVLLLGTASVDRNDYEYSTGEKFGSARSTYRSTTLQGSLALHERVSLDLALGRSLYKSKFTSTPSGYSSTTSDANNYAGIGLSLRPVGSPTSEGFGLVTSLWGYHPEGGDTTYSLGVQPQYRVNSSWLGVMSFNLMRGADDYRSLSITSEAVWKITPNMSLMPGLTWQRSEFGAGSPAYRRVTASVAYAYHFNRALSVLAEVELTGEADREYAPGWRSVNNHGSGFTAGVRWAF